MYTLTRRLSVVCLTVVLSLLVYGCGGSSKQALIKRDAAVVAAMTAEQEKDAAVAAAMTAEQEKDAAVAAAMTAEQEKDAAVAAAMTAEQEKDAAVAAEMTAEQEKDAAVAAAMTAEQEKDAAVEELRLAELRANPNPVDLSELSDAFTNLTPGTTNIDVGDNKNIGGVNAECFVAPCEVIVDEDGNIVSAGGVVTVQYSVAAKTTIMAIALSADEGALDMQEATMGLMNAPITNLAPVDVEGEPVDQRVERRGPDGDVEITLTHTDDGDEVEYTPEAVDSGHAIAGWMGQTLKRDDGMAATEDDKAVPETEMDEATVYTNIELAKVGKLKYGGDDDDFPANTVMRIGVDEAIDEIAKGDTFTGDFIRRADGSRIPGTFTCAADPCTLIPTALNDVGLLLLDAPPDNDDWTFVSDHNVKEGETPDVDYMYFGYWLKSPVDIAPNAEYKFVAFAGGNDEFEVPNQLIILELGDGLEATYVGGAAGRYVTRNLTITNGAVDVNSPGSHGRFTAKAELTANFGIHEDLMVDDETVAITNTIGGTITEFKNGDMDLGFNVTLGRVGITLASTFSGDTVTATFGNDHNDTSATVGAWSGNFFGANADDDDDADSTLPSGVAGKFNVATTDGGKTRVVGAFAAEEK